MSDQEEKSALGGEIAATTVMGEGLGEYEWVEFLPLAFGGHCYYVRQDVTGDQWGEHFMQREIGGIAIPDSAANHSQFVTVLGIGPRVGQPCSKAHKLEYKRDTRCALADNVKVGDRLIVGQPTGQFDNRLKRSPLNWDVECFIEEGYPVAIVEDE